MSIFPIELITLIVNNLERCQVLNLDHNSWTARTRRCIEDMRNVRLVCRSLCQADLPLFGRVLSDKPYALTPGSLAHLFALSTNPRLSGKIQTLVFKDCYFFNPDGDPDFKELICRCRVYLPTDTRKVFRRIVDAFRHSFLEYEMLQDQFWADRGELKMLLNDSVREVFKEKCFGFPSSADKGLPRLCHGLAGNISLTPIRLIL